MAVTDEELDKDGRWRAATAPNPKGFETLGFVPKRSGERRSQSYLRSNVVNDLL
jgi:hypothetical protein